MPNSLFSISEQLNLERRINSILDIDIERGYGSYLWNHSNGQLEWEEREKCEEAEESEISDNSISYLESYKPTPILKKKKNMKSPIYGKTFSPEISKRITEVSKHMNKYKFGVETTWSYNRDFMYKFEKSLYDALHALTQFNKIASKTKQIKYLQLSSDSRLSDIIIHDDLDKNYQEINKNFEFSYSHIIDKVRNNDIIYNELYKCHIDDNLVEAPTKVFESNQLEDYLCLYLYLKKYFSKENMIESSVSSLYAEGGGHIHIDHPYFKNTNEENKEEDKKCNLFSRNLNAFIINNPWIVWAFNGPNDNDNAIINPRNLNNYNHDLSNRKKLYDYSNNTINFSHANKTLEFRFLMMPRSLEENILHIELVYKIINYLVDLTEKNITLKINQNHDSDFKLKEITLSESLKGLDSIMKTLNIKKKDYKIKIPILKERYAMENYKDYLV